VNANERSIKMMQLKSFYSSAVFGNDKMLKPRWQKGNILTDPEYFSPQKWTYIYDHSALVQTLEKYIDYDKLKPNDEPFPHMYENADFSPETIKSSINEGYTKTLQALKGI
jgi:hypothetical protein